MLVLNMNSKRQRRPNVRLGEVGDLPAAFACGFSHRTKQSLVHKNYEIFGFDYNEDEQNRTLGFSMQGPPEFVVSGPGVSPKSSADLQQNRENKNPNSSKLACELVSSDETDMSKLKLNFGSITRKCRAMKRKGRCTKSANDAIGSVWSSKLDSQIASEDREDCATKQFVKFTSDEFNDFDPANGFKDLSDDETPVTSKEACENDVDETAFDMTQGECNEFRMENDGSEENYASPVSDNMWDEMRSGDVDMNIVSRWLEKQGFSKYAGLFEMHEVDEETLPLLTLEDLKEMGMFAVGSRRKLYNAIQRLRKDGVSVCDRLNTFHRSCR